MVDLAAIEPPAVEGVEAVALSQEVLQRPLVCGVRRLVSRPVGADKFRRLRSMLALRPVFDVCRSPSFYFDCRVPVRQPIEDARSPYRRKVPRIQAEEIHPRLAAIGNVGSD